MHTMSACTELRAQQNKIMHIRIGHVNIQGAKAHTPQLSDALQELAQRPQIIATTETHHHLDTVDNNEIKNYSWIGKPSNKRSRGTGFWVHDSLINWTSEISHPEEGTAHPDIHWIRIVSKKHTLYIAVCYSHPGDDKNHSAILAALNKCILALGPKDDFVITGDFNSRSNKLTGDRIIQATHYSTSMENFVNSHALTALRNTKTDRNGPNYTFNGPGGHSIPDYILVKGNKTANANYTVHPQDFGSYHKLITARIEFPLPSNEEWGSQIHQQIKWDDNTKARYLVKLKNTLPLLPSTTTSLSRKGGLILAKQIENAITLALDSIPGREQKGR
jgi:hypothetical protein